MKRFFALLLFCLIIAATSFAQTTIKTEEVNFEDYGICLEKATVKSSWPYSKHGITQYYKGNVLVAKVNYVNGTIDGNYNYYFYNGCQGKLRETDTYKNGAVTKKIKYECDDANGSTKKVEELIYEYEPGINKLTYFFNILELEKKSHDLSWSLDYSNEPYNTMAECIKKYNLSGYKDLNRCESLIQAMLGGSKKFTYYYSDGTVASDKKLFYLNGAIAVILNNKEVKVYDKSGKIIGWKINGGTNLYDNGQVIKSGDTTFYKNGKIMSVGTYLSFYENGIKQRAGDTIFFQSGKIESIGYGISFYENGIKKKSGDTTFFQNGKACSIGTNRLFYENGNKKKSVDSTFFSNGVVKEVNNEVVKTENDSLGRCVYKYNKVDNSYIEYYSSGNIKLKGSFTSFPHITYLLFTKGSYRLTYDSKNYSLENGGGYFVNGAKNIALEYVPGTGNSLKLCFDNKIYSDDFYAKGFKQLEYIKQDTKKDDLLKIKNDTSNSTLYIKINKSPDQMEFRSIQTGMSDPSKGIIELAVYSGKIFKNGFWETYDESGNLIDLKCYECGTLYDQTSALVLIDTITSIAKSQFLKNFKSSKPNKLIYSKALMVIDDLTTAYKGEKEQKKKMLLEYGLALFISDLNNNFSPDGNPELTEKLKKAKTVDEIKALLSFDKK